MHPESARRDVPPAPTHLYLAVRRIRLNIPRQLLLPPVSVGQELLLVVQQLLVGLGRELEVRTLDDRVDGAGLLAVAAIWRKEKQRGVSAHRLLNLVPADLFRCATYKYTWSCRYHIVSCVCFHPRAAPPRW